MARGGADRGHIWNIPSAASAEAAQRLLQPPRARGRHGGRAAGPGAVLSCPMPKPRAATAKPCLRPPPQIAQDRESMQCPIHELAHRENLQGSWWQCARATCSFCDNTLTNLEMTRPIRIWAQNNYQATMCYRLFLTETQSFIGLLAGCTAVTFHIRTRQSQCNGGVVVFIYLLFNFFDL